MADPDPLAELLRKAPLSDEQRATLWDAYHAAATPQDLATALQPLKLPNPIKADLWDLKAGRQPSAADPLARLPPNEQPRNLFGRPVSLPPDVAAQYAATRDQLAGRAPMPAGDAVVQNAQGLASYAPEVGGTIGAIYGGPGGAAVGAGLGKVVDLAANPARRADTTLGMAGQVAGNAAVAAAIPAAAEGLRLAIPAKAATAAKFQQVMGAAKDVPIDVNAPGTVALRIQELAERGGSMPKVVRDFLRRVTDPDKAPLAYQEARDFYSNISRLSADEFKRLTPVMTREVGNLRAALSRSLEDATAAVGKLSEYQGAMRDYARRAAVDDLAADVWTGIKRAAPFAGATGLATYAVKKLSDLMSGQ